MTRSTPRRGRPNGTGKQDAVLLEAVAARLASDPSQSAAAVIRSLGVTDPSSVRRLREKLKSHAPAPGRSSGRAAGKPLRSVAAARNRGPRLVEDAAKARADDTSGATKRSAPAATAAPVDAPVPAASPRVPTISPMSLTHDMQRAAATLIDSQIRIGAALMRSTPLGLLVQQQTMLANLVLGTMQTQRRLWESFVAAQAGALQTPAFR